MDELIEKYFEGTLTASEQITFNTKMKDDVAFREEVTFYQELKSAVSVSERQKIKREIQQFEKKEVPVFSIKPYLKYVALFIVSFALTFYLLKQKPSHDKLYSTYFEAYPNTEISNTRSQTNAEAKLNEAFIAYDLEDYKTASTLFDQVLTTSGEEYVFFYKAISLMKLEKCSEALQIFEENNWSINYEEKVTWYQALCLVKEGNVVEAKKSLETIVENYTFKKEKAKELLSKL